MTPPGIAGPVAPPTCGSARSRAWPHPAWRALGNTDADRAIAYRHLLDEALPDDLLAEIRQYLQQQRAWGRDDFRTMVEIKTRRFAGIRAAHRPRKATSPDK